MAVVNYANIRNQLKSILAADALTSGARIYIEEEPQFGLQDAQTVIAIFMDSRSAAGGDQSVSMGKRTRFNVRFTIWTLAFSIESYLVACDLRDTLLGNLELVLMKDRTVSGTVDTSWLDGGEMISARDSGSGVFVAAAETVLVTEVSAINT